MADNTLINATTVAGGDISRSLQRGGGSGPKTQVTALDLGGAAGEVLVLAETANPAPTVAAMPVRTAGDGFVSTLNSTTTNLALGASFTGTAENVSQYASISVMAFSSSISAADGLILEQSVNGVDWDSSDTYTLVANTGKVFQLAVVGQFFRLRYTNGGITTLAIRIQTIYHKSHKRGSSIRMLDARSVDNDFDETVSYMAMFNGTSFDRVRGTIANGLTVDVTRSALPTGAATEATVAGLLTNTQLRASAVPVSVATDLDTTATGTLTAAAQTVVLAIGGHSGAAVQLSGTWVGTVTFEGTVDGTNWNSVNAVAATTSTPQATTTVNGLYRLTPGGLVSIRANMTAFTSGSATVTMRSGGVGGTFANQILPTKNTDGVSTQAIKAASTAAVSADSAAVVAIHPLSQVPVTLNTVGTLSAATVAPSSNAAVTISAALAVGAIGSMANTAEVASAARTTTGNSGLITDVLGGAMSGTLNVTAVSGTTPTLDLVLQESPDNGTTWIDVYHFERVTAAGVYPMPSLPINGRRRWAWTITGTTPSFTFSISVSRGGAHNFSRFVQFFDRTAALLAGTASAASAAYQVVGCRAIAASITIGAATTPAQYNIQGSLDGINWFDIASRVPALANSTVCVISTSGAVARFARVIVSIAGSAQTGVVVGLIGTD